MFRVLLFSLISSAAFLAAAPQPQPFRRPLVFEPNRGQAPAPATWIARGPGYQLFLSSQGMTMIMQEGSGPKPVPAKPTYSTVKMKLSGSRPWNHVAGLEPTGGISNYIRGNDAKTSLTSIPHYARVSAAGVYDGIDLVFYDRGGDLEYDFVVAAGADPRQIRLAFEGMEGMRVDDKSGDLILTTAGGSELRQARPKVYQQVGERRVEVAGGYELLGGGRAGFQLAAYDPRRPLLIDPYVNFTRFLTGSNSDIANAIAVDGAGNSYVTGTTLSSNFPELYPLHHFQNNKCTDSWLFPTPGFRVCASEPGDAFVTKLAPDGTILFSTFLGGNWFDYGNAIAVDATGVYVAGSTASDDFPVKDPTGGGRVSLGGADLFAAKLSLNGITLIYSRVIGGSGDEGANGIAVDSQHAVWVTGETTSRNFLVGTPGAGSYYYASANGPSDVFYTKFDAAGNWQFSGLSGGSGTDRGAGVAIDRDDRPWFTGQTCSADFPATPGYNYLRGRCGVFVLTNQSQAGGARFGVVFGGSDDDSGTAIVVDANREAFITGYTRNPLFPVRTGGFQTVPASTGAQAFVMKLDGFGHWIYSTFLGGNGDTFGRAIALNASRAVYVAGETSSSNFPGASALTPNPTAGFVSWLSPDLSTLNYTQLLGAQVKGVALAPSTVNLSDVLTAGWRYTGNNQDAFVVQVGDDLYIPLTGTWKGTYTYGADCGYYTGKETLVLTDLGGRVSGSVSDVNVSGTFPGHMSGNYAGLTLTFTSAYDSGATATFTGTINNNGIEGRFTGVCGSGATATFTRQ